jgi:predicted adenylyl cyclase CyaB
MARNVEIKARVEDMPALLGRVETIADPGPRVIRQEDTFFHCPKGRLKFRRFSEKEGELIYYERLDATGPTESHYTRTSSYEPDALTDVLSQALGVRGVVRKRRTLYRAGQTRIHLDDVEGLGTFLELEVVLEPGQSTSEGAEIARELMKQLDVKESDLVESAYVDLLEQRHGHE